MSNSFSSLGTFSSGGQEFQIARRSAREAAGLPVSHLPYSLRILLENLLRREDGLSVPAADPLNLTAPIPPTALK